jgi:hypothetical protein
MQASEKYFTKQKQTHTQKKTETVPELLFRDDVNGG